jgi:chromosome segregation ATPase
MKKIFHLSALFVFAFGSDLFAQDYMKMRKKQLRIEHQKKLKLIDSLSQELSLSNKKSQNLQSDLNNSSNDLILTSDSLKNSNLEITQLEGKLSDSNVELTQLVLEMKDFILEDSLKNTVISSLKKENENLLMAIDEKKLQTNRLENSSDNSKTENFSLIVAQNKHIDQSTPFENVLISMKSDQINLFISSFSERVVDRLSNKKTWVSRFNKGKERFAKRYGHYKVTDFSYGFESTDSKLIIYYNGIIIAEMSVIKENGGWKLNEH